MEITQIISLGLSIIGGATVLFRIIAPLTETKIDNKILKVLEKVLSIVALNKSEKKLTIKLD